MPLLRPMTIGRSSVTPTAPEMGSAVRLTRVVLAALGAVAAVVVPVHLLNAMLTRFDLSDPAGVLTVLVGAAAVVVLAFPCLILCVDAMRRALGVRPPARGRR